MLYFKEEVLNDNGTLVNLYKGASLENMRNEVEMLMLSMGYKHLGGGTFEKGSRVMRILFGAFCKYFKFTIGFEQRDDEIRMTVTKSTTGMSGGVIGMNQVKKEFEILKKSFQTI